VKKWRVVSEERQIVRSDDGLFHRSEEMRRYCHGPSTAWPVALANARKKKTGHFGRDDNGFCRSGEWLVASDEWRERQKRIPRVARDDISIVREAMNGIGVCKPRSPTGTGLRGLVAVC
jgi:hypothetical protein